ncbi:hypothetical protein AMECASPLE_016053 [Ameca splendens]|uniref:Uncharacterized protein n=1 Tax=Ameca splendens TaxID=208324 RepID=A0ABV1A9I3_9TELE
MSINRSSKKSQVIHGPPLPELPVTAALPPRGGNTTTTGTIYIPTLPKDNVNPSGNSSTTPIPIFKWQAPYRLNYVINFWRSGPVLSKILRVLSESY